MRGSRKIQKLRLHKYGIHFKHKSIYHRGRKRPRIRR